LEPLERTRRSEEARLGVITWERDTQRLEQILWVIREGDRILGQLADSLSQWDPQIYHGTTDASSMKSWIQAWRSALRGLKLGKTLDPRQRWLREWFRQYIVESGRAEEKWRELLSSVEDEERIIIEIKSEWCERS